MPRKRILFLAEGATLAHFVRPLVLAEAVDCTRYETHFYAPAAFSRYLEGKPFLAGRLETMPGEKFLRNIASGAPLPPDVIRAYIEEDRKLLRSIKPDLVIGDMRLSLPISAHLEEVRLTVIMNAYWSPYSPLEPIMPALPLTRVIPPQLLKIPYNLLSPFVFAHHARQMNRIRNEYGMKPLPPDLRIMYTEGDYVLYPDIPEFAPTSGLPANHSYVGICPWTPATVRPEWWERMRRDPKPKVFVSLGSSGALRVFSALRNVLSRLPISVILATAGRQLPGAADIEYVTELLPLKETAASSTIVVTHGGSTGIYPAIEAGTPVLGIPSNADQQLASATLEQSGAGLRLRVEEASEKRILQALEQLLHDARYREAAQRWSGVYSRYDSRALFREFLSKVLN